MTEERGGGGHTAPRTARAVAMLTASNSGGSRDVPLSTCTACRVAFEDTIEHM